MDNVFGLMSAYPASLPFLKKINVHIRQFLSQQWSKKIILVMMHSFDWVKKNKSSYKESCLRPKKINVKIILICLK